MNVGIASIFSFRPHVDQLVYLARLLESGGHRVFGLTCDASVTTCYGNLLRGYSRLRGCPACIAGGLRSYPLRVDAISARHRRPLATDVRRSLAASSAYTLHRIETAADCEAPEVIATQDRFASSLETVVGSAGAWIERRRLDAVLCFNGRMDLTRAVTYACELAGIPFVTVERPWLGHGLFLTPNDDCLSLREPGRLAAEFRSSPLTARQARIAGHLIAARYLKRNTLEWRLYHPQAVSASWPGRGDGPRVLVLPNSNNEFYSSRDWRSEFSADLTVGVDRVLGHLGATPGNVVLRCHPNWGETIGLADGELSARLYRGWAERRGVFTIPSEEPCDTYDLIRQADIVLVTGGSAGAEAAALGKTVISIIPSPYLRAGFAQHVLSPGDLDKLRLPHATPREIAARALRYFYVSAGRVPQYVDYVRALQPTRFVFLEGGDPARLERIFATGELTADDPEVAADDAAESEVVDLLLARAWEELFQPAEERRESTVPVRRRLALRWIDRARERLPHGDR